VTGRGPAGDRGPVRRAEGGVTVELRVLPRARLARIDGVAANADGGEMLRVSVTAPPEDGKANAAVIALLARAWRVPKRDITVVRGAGSRQKTVRVEGDPATLERVIRETSDGKGKDPHG